MEAYHGFQFHKHNQLADKLEVYIQRYLANVFDGGANFVIDE